MEVKAYLAHKRSLVETALEQALPAEAGPSKEIAEAMRYSLFAGGKRLRPILCLAGAEAVGGDPMDAMPAAVALEMIHTYSLIHDDLPVMDDDDLRRGKPTNHKVFGEASAVLAGDALLTEGLAVLARCASGGEIILKRAVGALDLIATAAGYKGMVAGQLKDLASEGKTLGEDEIRTMHFHKTGALIMASVVSGAIMAGSSLEQRQALEIYGKSIGFAFQVRDDLLDLEGSAEQLGKNPGMDNKRGKATFPGVVGIEKARQEAAKEIDNAIEALSGFGRQSEPLVAIAEYILDRRK